MKTALIGYTGFVGNNLVAQHHFDDVYNSKNIAEIKNKEYDLVISAGNSSLMWMANKEPEKDWQNIQAYMACIESVTAARFVLLSTIEIYDTPYEVNEDSKTDITKIKPYGQHRYKLEEFIKRNFASSTIVRLPNLYGKGLKKNFVYDLMHNNRLDLVHKDSIQQWYNLEHIWHDLSVAIDNDLPLVNFATEPIRNQELAKELMNLDFINVTEAPPRKYNMQTKYAELFGAKPPYLADKKAVLRSLKKFVAEERKSG